jgi:hypothetical protein
MRSMDEATLVRSGDDQVSAVVYILVFFVINAILRVFCSVAGVGSFGISIGDHLEHEIFWI